MLQDLISWELFMSSKFTLDQKQVAENIKSLQDFMQKEGVEAFYISSSDPFLNEYVPMENCHRFYLTQFSGSVAEVLFPQKGKVKLYVDGRYHEQADVECDHDLVDVVKVPSDKSNIACLKEDLASLAPKNIAIEADRTSLAFYEYLNENFEVKAYLNQELEEIIDFKKMPPLAKIKHLAKNLRGADTSEKLKRVIKDEQDAYYITAIDSLAWLTNCRGYHLPNLSSFLGRGFATFDKVYVFIDESVEVECSDPCVEFININSSHIKEKLNELKQKYNLSRIFIDKSMLNSQDYLMLKSVFSEDILVEKKGGLVEYQAIKDSTEIKAIKESFKRADKAIYNTLSWVKDQISQGHKVSEYDVYEMTSKMYQQQGALEQSFNTIAGADANGSLIHYSDPKPDLYLNEQSMVLLDSGGYFESGFATDTTRTFMAGQSEGSAKQKEIYTLVLKGTLALQNAVFRPETKGNALDAVCRQPLFQAGYDFAHGTGHGVGIHVHEGGTGISPRTNYPIRAGHVISIEPGIYLPGFGGVRIENIGLVVEHPKYAGFLTFEPLVYIGFDPLLIEQSLLNQQEMQWLKEYEAICKERGTSFY